MTHDHNLTYHNLTQILHNSALYRFFIRGTNSDHSTRIGDDFNLEMNGADKY